MFRIGEFSRIARVSARLLRYYDELGLLKPGVVDAVTGYRYYTSAQLQRLNRILVLRDLGLSLEQIGAVIGQNASTHQLRAMLELRRADAERALSEEGARLRQIEARIAQLEDGDDTPDDVLIRAEPARRIIAVRDTVASFVEARGLLGELAHALPKLLPRELLGPVIGIAHSAEFEPDTVDVELGFVLMGDPPALPALLGAHSLHVRELPAIAHMAVCVRVGLPEHAHLITGKIGRYVERSGYRLAGLSREVFLRPPRLDRMEESVVEMQFPVEPIG